MKYQNLWRGFQSPDAILRPRMPIGLSGGKSYSRGGPMNLMRCKQLFVSMVFLFATVSWAQQSGLRAVPPLVPLRAGTPLTRCTISASCPQGYNAVFFLFSDNFYAQPFSLTTAVHVDSVLFV